jgi:hypothetical protein
MGSASAPKGSNTYTEQKFVAEELRSLAIEYKLPVFSGIQTNRSGYDTSEVGMGSVADSMGVVHTADCIFSLYSNDELEENKEAICTFIKNRYGEVGRVARIGFDKSKMRIYDVDKDDSGVIDYESEKMISAIRKQQESKPTKTDGLGLLKKKSTEFNF